MLACIPPSIEISDGGTVMKIDGNCHCGNIKYEADIDPGKVYICHCTDCQSISGSPFRWAVSIPAEKFRLLSGEPKTYKKRSDSGGTSHQLFCPDCASPVYSTTPSEGPQFYNLRLGTARQRAQLSPKAEVWCGSAQGWIAVHGETGKLETQ